MYQKGVLLVRDEDLNRVLAIVAPPETEILDPVYPDGRFPRSGPCGRSGRRDPGNPGRSAAGDTGDTGPAWRPQLRRVTRGLVALALFGSRFEDDDYRDDDAEPQDEAGPVRRASGPERDRPAAGRGGRDPESRGDRVARCVPCMAHEAEEVPLGIEPEPGPCPGHGGAGVRIFVADTGLVARRGGRPRLDGGGAG